MLWNSQTRDSSLCDPVFSSPTKMQTHATPFLVCVGNYKCTCCSSSPTGPDTHPYRAKAVPFKGAQPQVGGALWAATGSPWRAPPSPSVLVNSEGYILQRGCQRFHLAGFTVTNTVLAASLPALFSVTRKPTELHLLRGGNSSLQGLGDPRGSWLGSRQALDTGQHCPKYSSPHTTREIRRGWGGRHGGGRGVVQQSPQEEESKVRG